MTITLHKETDETRVNDVTPSEDADFQFELPANFTGNICIEGTITGNSIKCLFSLPDGASGKATMTLIKDNSTNSIRIFGRKIDLTDAAAINAAWPVCFFRLSGYIKTGENGGTCKFLWSQNTASSTATVLEAGATMTIIGETL